MNRFTKTTTSLIALGLLAGCAAQQEAKQKTENNIAAAEKQIRVFEEIKDTKKSPNTNKKDTIWVGPNGIKITNGEPLPDHLELPGAITFTGGKKLSLLEITNEISRQTNIKVQDVHYLMTGTSSAPSTGTPAEQAPATTSEGGSGMPQRGQLDPIFGNLGSLPGTGSYYTNGTTDFPPMDLKYKGKLSGLLDQIGNFYGIDWEYKNGAIRFIASETKMYSFYALNNEVEADTSVNGSTTGGKESGGSNSTSGSQTKTAQSAKSKIVSKYWEEIESSLQKTLPPGANWSINKTTGTLTVRARPSILRQVEEFVRAENEKLGRQMVVSVEVYSISVDSTDNYSLDLTAAFKDISSGVTGGLSSITPLVVDGAGKITAGIISGNSQKSKQFAGSSAAINAFSEAGKTTLLTSANIVSMNNQTTPVSVVTETGYLEKIETTLVRDNSQTSLTPGKVNNGFTMNITPRIFTGGEIMMNLAITLSDLVDIGEFGTTDAKIQIPKVDTRAISQTTKMTSGDTLVMTGFERNTNSNRDRGVGSPNNWFFGGGVKANNKKEVIAILVTPIILDTNKAIKAQ